jgi:hypothetical protein
VLILALMAMAIWMVQGAVATSTVMHTITASAKTHAMRDASVYTESALAEARTRLKGMASTNPKFAGDPVASQYAFYASTPNLNWSAYLLTSNSWQFSKDPEYSQSLTNYVPTTSSLTNTSITVNSIQGTLPYWIKMRHKREYDAEQYGHRTTSPHYVDNDGSTALNSPTNRGRVLYYGYPASTTTTPTQFTTSAPYTDWPQVEIVTIYSELGGQTQKIQAEIVRDVGPPLPGALYSKGNVNFMQNTATVNGDDACYNATPQRPPVYLMTPGTISGSAHYSGSPGSPTTGTISIDIGQYITKYKVGATVLTTDQSLTNYGSTTNYVTVYSNTAAPPNLNGLTLKDLTGYGLLLVEGDLILEEDINWYGLILVTGTLQFNISTTQNNHTVTVHGAVLAGNIVGVKDEFEILYDSCQIAHAMATQPTKLLNLQRS